MKQKSTFYVNKHYPELLEVSDKYGEVMDGIDDLLIGLKGNFFKIKDILNDPSPNVDEFLGLTILTHSKILCMINFLEFVTKLNKKINDDLVMMEKIKATVEAMLKRHGEFSYELTKKDE